MRGFALGLVEGLAKSTTKGVNDAMNDLDGRISRLSEKKINREINERSRFDKDFQGNEQEIKFMANQLNANGGTRGIEVLHSLINTETFAGAKAILPSIVEKLNRNGLVAGDTYMPLGTTTDGQKIPTSKQLANLITIPMNIGDDADFAKGLEGTGMGILNIFSRGEDRVSNYINKRVKMDRTLAGVNNIKTDYGELSAASDINIDKFDLQLGKSYAGDLKLIRGRIDQLGNKAPQTLIDQEKKISVLVENISDKQYTIPQQIRTKGSYEASLSKYANIDGRLELDGSWNSANKKYKNSGIASSFANKFKDLAVWSKSVNGRNSSTKLTARGIIPETSSSNFTNLSDSVFDQKLEPNTFLEYASQSGMDVKKVTKEMIKTGEYQDLNDGQPYLTIGDKIDFDSAEMKKNSLNSGLPQNKVFNNNQGKFPNRVGGINVETLKISFANASKKATQARKFKVYFTSKGILTEAERKIEFKKLTGTDWLPSYGNIE